MRLQKFLADCQICSRRRAEHHILDGDVCVNGIQIEELGTKVEDGDVVTFRGKVVTPPTEYVYIMLHKPWGYVSTVKDELGRPTIMELVSDISARIVPVGRLDYNTSGLLLMTNDGALTYRLTHPKHEIKKTYIAKLEGTPSEHSLINFRKGLFIEDYKTAPAQIMVVKEDERASSVKITIGEGRNRQVRKMCDAMGHTVISLKRISTGKLELGSLEMGQYRHLTKEEVAYLKEL